MQPIIWNKTQVLRQLWWYGWFLHDCTLSLMSVFVFKIRVTVASSSTCLFFLSGASTRRHPRGKTCCWDTGLLPPPPPHPPSFSLLLPPSHHLLLLSPDVLISSYSPTYLDLILDLLLPVLLLSSLFIVACFAEHFATLLWKWSLNKSCYYYCYDYYHYYPLFKPTHIPHGHRSNHSNTLCSSVFHLFFLSLRPYQGNGNDRNKREACSCLRIINNSQNLKLYK